MKAVVLVGGFGTRLRPLTLTRPKQLVPVGNRPMIESVMGRLGEVGVTEAVLALGYRPDAFSEAYPDGVCAGVRLSFAIEDEPLGTAGAIRFAARTAGIDDTFLVCNGDVLTDLDPAALIELHRRRRARATLHLTRVDDPSRFGVVPTDADGQVLGFVEKPPPGQAPTDQINAGTYVLDPEVIERIPDGRAVSIERETFPALVEGGQVYAMATDDYWLDAGTPEALLAANLDLIDGRRPGWDDAAVRGRVEPGARVERSLVGEGALLEAGAQVIDSVIDAGAVIGAGAVVRSSLIGRGAHIGAGARLEELSVIGDEFRVADGAHLVAQRRPESD